MQILPFIILFVMSLFPNKPLPPVHFHVLKSYYYTQEDQKKLDGAIDLLNRVVNSPEFQKRILDARFTETNDLTNKQVLNILLGGMDGIGHIDLKMAEYNNPKVDVIGFVRSDLPGTVFQNRFYMWNKYVMAANLLHETLHLLGFDHHDEKHLDTTIPYLAQQIFLEVLDRYGDMQ